MGHLHKKNKKNKNKNNTTKNKYEKRLGITLKTKKGVEENN